MQTLNCKQHKNVFHFRILLDAINNNYSIQANQNISQNKHFNDSQYIIPLIQFLKMFLEWNSFFLQMLALMRIN